MSGPYSPNTVSRLHCEPAEQERPTRRERVAEMVQDAEFCRRFVDRRLMEDLDELQQALRRREA